LTDGISDDPGLVSLDRPGMWKFSLDFIPKRPVLFLNLYNNQWNTNYRYWYQGTWSSRGRLWTFGNGTVIGEALITPSLEARHPLQAALAEGPGGRLPTSRNGLELSRKGVLVTAFTPTLIRVWERAGTGWKAGPTFMPGQYPVQTGQRRRGVQEDGQRQGRQALQGRIHPELDGCEESRAALRSS
jgi:hypothetical protein